MTVAVGWSEVSSNTPNPVKVRQHILEDAFLRIEVDLMQVSILRGNQHVLEVIVWSEEASDVDDAIEVSEDILEEALLWIEVHLVDIAVGGGNDNMLKTIDRCKVSCYAGNIA